MSSTEPVVRVARYTLLSQSKYTPVVLLFDIIYKLLVSMCLWMKR